VELSVGVPVIAPVDVLKLNPAGRVGEMEKARGAVPPDPVTGINDVAAVAAVRVVLAIAWVAVSGPLIDSANTLALVALLASVAVTV
jgi:hypothetical protein